MGDQELARKDVWYCFTTVRDLIEDLTKNLPEETIIGDNSWASEKGKVNEALALLDYFFKNLPKIKKTEIDEFARIVDKLKGPEIYEFAGIVGKLKGLKEPYEYACGNHATINTDPPKP
jgi:hypothetical protein